LCIKPILTVFSVRVYPRYFFRRRKSIPDNTFNQAFQKRLENKAKRHPGEFTYRRKVKIVNTLRVVMFGSYVSLRKSTRLRIDASPLGCRGYVDANAFYVKIAKLLLIYTMISLYFLLFL